MSAFNNPVWATHDRLLQEALNAARSIAWGDLSSEAIVAEREANRRYYRFCDYAGLEPFDLRLT